MIENTLDITGREIAGEQSEYQTYYKAWEYPARRAPRYPARSNALDSELRDSGNDLKDLRASWLQTVENKGLRFSFAVTNYVWTQIVNPM